MKSLFDRAARVISEEENLEMEHKHLREVFKLNNYPNSIISGYFSLTDKSSSLSSSVSSGSSVPIDKEAKKKTIVIPYVKGLSEDVRRICGRYDVRVAFKSGQSLRNSLTRVKDTLHQGMQSKVVYHIPCSCGKVYIGETIRRLETRVKEHEEACKKGELDKSALAEHAWTNQHPIKWNEATVVARAKNQIELRLKEALDIMLHQEGSHM